MQNALKWGVFCAAAGIVVGLISYLAGISLNPDFAWVRWIGFIAGMVLLFLGVREKKSEDPESFTFGKGWVATFLISVVAGVVSAVWVFLYTTVIEPEMIEMTLAAQRTAFVAAKMSREDMDNAMKMTSMFVSPGGFAITTIVSYLIFGSILGLIISPIVKSTGNNNLPTNDAATI